MTDPPATRDDNRFREAEERGRLRGHSEAADYLERVAAEWSGTDCGQAVARALRLEARNVRRLYLECRTRSIVER